MSCSERAHACVAEFTEPRQLIAAARAVREAGFTRYDAHTPFPVHGLDDAMAVRPTRLPWLALGAGLFGLGLALLLQWWTNAVDYPFLISGKPLFGLPAAIPVAFELTILCAALSVFFGVLVRNGLPRHHNPLLGSELFARASQDRFFLVIEARDPRFDEAPALLEGLGATAVETCVADDSPSRVPGILRFSAALVALLALVPFALIAKARFTKSEDPRIHLSGDMDWQPKLKPQQASNLFADGRAMRPQVKGTVARGQLREDDHLWLGKVDGEWAKTLPLRATRELMEAGRRSWRVHCATCHGQAGYGDGMIAKRADALQVPTWVPPTSMHTPHVRTQPDGKLYDTITNGIRNMAGYRRQIPVAERWGIVLFIRALQRSQNASVQDLPAEYKGDFR